MGVNDLIENNLYYCEKHGSVLKYRFRKGGFYFKVVRSRSAYMLKQFEGERLAGFTYDFIKNLKPMGKLIEVIYDNK